MKLNRKWLFLLVGLVIVFIVDFPILTVASEFVSNDRRHPFLSQHYPDPADACQLRVHQHANAFLGIFNQQQHRCACQHRDRHRAGVARRFRNVAVQGTGSVRV